MERHTFKIPIDAPREKVWDILWSVTTFREWTTVFSEGSHAESDWKQGSKILFLDGKGAGMVSTIAVKKPPEFMSFKHLGEVHDGVEDLTSKKVSEWSGALESYMLKNVNGKTELSVEIDLADEFKDYFLETFPKALDKVKSMAERRREPAAAPS